MDSCVTLAQAIADGVTPAALHINYGQRTQSRELQAFTEICDYYAVEQRLIVDISHLAQIGGSALTDLTIDVPVHQRQEQARDLLDIPKSVNPPVTYVPFRNANILAIGTSWAEVIGATSLYIGAVEEDSSGYPDCREVFFTAYQAMISAGTRPDTEITIRTPLIHLRKQQIVLLGQRLSAPLQLTWSCYSAEETACGCCDSCTLRLRGFALAGITDPIRYKG